jgi:hypothetical protein
MECPKRCKKVGTASIANRCVMLDNTAAIDVACFSTKYVMLQMVLIILLVFYIVFNSYRNDDRLSILEPCFYTFSLI